MPGIYIHIPFCKQACNYCNFHFSTSLKQKDDLIAALVKEIKLSFIASQKNDLIDTVYFGGGTPSILTIDDLKKIFDALHENFSINSRAEITLEANPDDISTEKLNAWKSTGINRLSVGVQSFFDEELTWMNRAHTATDSVNSIDKIIEAGFTNYSIDLIYGSPLLTNDSWKKKR